MKKVSIPTGSITVMQDFGEGALIASFQFQLVRLQFVLEPFIFKKLSSFNSNWFDYSGKFTVNMT